MELFIFFAVGQGCALLGFMIFIFYYYFPKCKESLRSMIRWHIVLISLSYILLMCASIRTASLAIYPQGDIWYYFVTASYLVANISAIVIFREAIKSEKNNNKK